MKTLWRDEFNSGRVELRSILSEGGDVNLAA
jgi:hypothetical protein